MGTGINQRLQRIPPKHPTGATITEKPNCSNCPPFLNSDWCKLIINNDKDLKLRKRDPNGIELMEYTKLCGCLYHPGAREYLMAPVIKELEQLQSTVYEDYGGRNARYAYENAITLIKNGVDRE